MSNCAKCETCCLICRHYLEATLLDNRLGLLAMALLTTVYCGCAARKSRTTYAATVNITRAVAYDCAEKCKSLMITLSVRNETSVLYCVSSDFDSRRASDYVTIVPEGSAGEEKAIHSAGMLPEGASNSDYSYAKFLLSGANRLIQPNATVLIGSVMQDNFSIVKSKSHLTLKIFAYPCDMREFDRAGFQKMVLQAPLKFSDQ